MESGKLANWLQILANVGLIAGLVLVAVQIKQNTDATKAQMVSEALAANLALKLAVVGENASSALSTAIDRPDALTTEEMVVLTNLQEANFTVRARNEWIDGLGYSFTPSSLTTAEGNADSTVWEFLDTPFGLAWWNYTNETESMWSLTPATTAEIERRLAAMGPEAGIQAATEIASLRAAISALQNRLAGKTGP